MTDYTKILQDMREEGLKVVGKVVREVVAMQEAGDELSIAMSKHPSRVKILVPGHIYNVLDVLRPEDNPCESVPASIRIAGHQVIKCNPEIFKSEDSHNKDFKIVFMKDDR